MARPEDNFRRFSGLRKSLRKVGHVWRAPPANLELSIKDVHIWRAPLDQLPGCITNLQQILSADEIEKAERFHFQRDRIRFVVARGTLRVILGRYLQMEPGRLRFSYTSHGKPYLFKTAGLDGLSFNLSHSHGLALYAITRGRKIGVDLERLQNNFDCQQIASAFFSPQENSMLLKVPSDMQLKAFFTCWTRKEAYIKARGEGLTLPLRQFDVSVTPSEPARLLHTYWDSQEAFRWSLQDLRPGPGYAAALAVEGNGWLAKCWHWAELYLNSCNSS